MKFAAKDADVRGEVQSVSSGGTKFDLVAHNKVLEPRGCRRGTKWENYV